MKSRALLVAGLVAGAALVVANQQTLYKLIWNGQEVSSSVRIIDGRAYVPVAELAEAMNLTVRMDQPNGQVIVESASAWGRNLVRNGGFEEGTFIVQDVAERIEIPGWEQVGIPTVAEYAGPVFGMAAESRPPRSGARYFSGSNFDGKYGVTQRVDLAGFRDKIAAGEANFAFQAFMGGWQYHDDKTDLFLRWLDANGSVIEESKFEAPTLDERNIETGFRIRQASGPVPSGAVAAVIVIEGQGTGNDWIDGYVDNVSLVLTER